MISHENITNIARDCNIKDGEWVVNISNKLTSNNCSIINDMRPSGLSNWNIVLPTLKIWIAKLLISLLSTPLNILAKNNWSSSNKGLIAFTTLDKMDCAWPNDCVNIESTRPRIIFCSIIFYDIKMFKGVFMKFVPLKVAYI